MLIYIARRTAMAISVLLVALVATFLLFFAGPADPAQSMCGELRCSPQKLQDIRPSMWLFLPVPEHFAASFPGLFARLPIHPSVSSTEPRPPCPGHSLSRPTSVRTAARAASDPAEATPHGSARRKQ